jgi:glycosyltransferase involved in cell wall biosynthesis
MDKLIAILAHNEERRIGACLASLPLDDAEVSATVVVNGSSDRTADIVREFEPRGVRLVEYAEPGKARSWNRFVLDEAPEADVFVFVDGDAVLAPGSVGALADCLARHPEANAAAALPLNGRSMAFYQRSMMNNQGFFGDCYALSGAFVRAMRDSGVRLPDDLVGDDSLVNALANTDLGADRDFRKGAVVQCLGAGFYCEPNPITPAGLRRQMKRMESYALRHFQNRILSDIMQNEGARMIPTRLADVYDLYLDRLRPRLNPLWFEFDRRALARIRAAA